MISHRLNSYQFFPTISQGPDRCHPLIVMGFVHSRSPPLVQGPLIVLDLYTASLTGRPRPYVGDEHQTVPSQVPLLMGLKREENGRLENGGEPVWMLLGLPFTRVNYVRHVQSESPVSGRLFSFPLLLRLPRFPLISRFFLQKN